MCAALHAILSYKAVNDAFNLLSEYYGFSKQEKVDYFLKIWRMDGVPVDGFLRFLVISLVSLRFPCKSSASFFKIALDLNASMARIRAISWTTILGG